MDANTILDATATYTSLRDAILKGRLGPGERLVAQRLADDMGVSRTPVKEALARLETEGLVVRAGHWGYSVRTISMRDAEEIFEARLVIEVANASRAAQRATETDAQAMTGLLSASRRHLKAKDLAEFQHCSRGVHEVIAQATGNAQLIRMFKQVNDLVVLFGVSLLRAHPARAKDILAENEAIVDAIRERRSDEAARLMQQHIESGHTAFRAAASSLRPGITAF